MGNTLAQKSTQVQVSQPPSLLEYTLSLSYEQRILAHQAALELLLELQRAGKRYYAEQS